MKPRKLLILGSLVVLFAAGCASNRESQRIDALERDPAWPLIRASAQMEVARKEGNTDWSHSAIFLPHQHTNSVWVVIASAHRGNWYGDSIDMLIGDDAKVISYAPRLCLHPR